MATAEFPSFIMMKNFPLKFSIQLDILSIMATMKMTKGYSLQTTMDITSPMSMTHCSGLLKSVNQMTAVSSQDLIMLMDCW